MGVTSANHVERSAEVESSRQQAVWAAIADISQIATLPEITLKVIRLVNDPESTASALSDVITHDPALGARILKIVNSGYYGLPGEIRSISQAIRLLGLNALKIIAIAASLGKLFVAARSTRRSTLVTCGPTALPLRPVRKYWRGESACPEPTRPFWVASSTTSASLSNFRCADPS